MTDVRDEQNFDNRNVSRGAELLGVQVNPTDILLEEVARLFQMGEPGKYNLLKLTALLKLGRALADHGAPVTKMTAQIRGFVTGLALRSGEAQELIHEVERLQGTLDGIMQRHEDELALVCQQLADAQHAERRKAADHQVELGHVRSRFEAETNKLTARIDELRGSGSGKSVAKLLADKEALRERLQRALNELADLRKGLKGPRKGIDEQKPNTENDCGHVAELENLRSRVFDLTTQLETLLAERDNDTDGGGVEAAVAELERQLFADAAAFGQRLDDIDQRIRALGGKPPRGGAQKNPAARRTFR